MLISYDAYRVFYTVARLGSFTKAAGTLLSSQPNLTRTIRNLESALGCTLFVRSNRGRCSRRRAKAVCALPSPANRFRRARKSWPATAACKAAWSLSARAKRRCTAFFCPCSARSTAPIRGFACALPTIPRRRRFPPCATACGCRRRHLPPRRTQAACTSSRSANSRRCPSAARR